MVECKKFLKIFAANVSGGAAIYAAITAPVMIGGAALSVDVSRMYNLDQELQSASDAYARAGAAELDGRSDSLVRARRAIHNLVNNGENYGDETQSKVTIASIRFLKETPSNGYDAVPAGFVTLNPNEAHYVEVKVAPTKITTLFPPTLAQGIASVDLDAVSTAGFEFGVCGTAPVFVCNPYEGTGMTLFEALEDEDERRRQIRFINPGGNCDTFAPGAFGYLDPFTKTGVSGANVIKDAVAIDKPATCFQSSGVHLRPGKISSMRDAVNVRFDIYKGRYRQSRFKNDPRYAPAENVTKGYALRRQRNSCSGRADWDAMALPRDACFDDDSCTDLHGMMGDGDWDFAQYVDVNHNGARALRIKGTTYRFNHNRGTVTPSTPPSRYDVYRWEIDSNNIPGTHTAMSCASNTPESGEPVCHSTGAYSGDVDRRIIHAAVLNCNELEQTYNLSGGSNPPLPAQAFIKVFITEPMGSGYYNSLYGEMVGVVEGNSAISRDTIAVNR
ncbi:MAG: TadE/TadG family type IV pilus assembly protein [Robiginitomaculum sp.]